MIRLDIYIFQVTGKPETFWVLSENTAEKRIKRSKSIRLLHLGGV